MNKESVILEGWLVKSPPEKKTWFRAKWRRRFFVLYEPSAADSLPGTRAALDYYRDETVSKRLASIDLTHCEEVLSSLDSSLYTHLFALRTKHKRHDRVYYLAADSEDVMNKWVTSLCCVLGLKENDDSEKPPVPPLPNDRPPPTQTLHAPVHDAPTLPHHTPAPVHNAPTLPDRPRTPLATPVSGQRSSPLPTRCDSLGHRPSNRSGSNGLSSSAPRTSQMNGSPRHGSLRQTGALKSSPLSASSQLGSRGEMYIPLDECYSDDKTQRCSPLDIVPPAPIHRDSFPAERAPMPPVKSGVPPAPEPADCRDGEMYDYPKRSYINVMANQDNGEYSYPPSQARGRSPDDDGDEGLYKVPPVHHVRIASSAQGGNYKVPPPPRHNLSPTATNSTNGLYDYPRGNSWYNSSEISERHASDASNLHKLLSTRVPLKPQSSRGPQVEDSYDVPPARKAVSENNLLDRVPPPQASVPEEDHGRYMNLPSNSPAHPGYVPPDSLPDYPSSNVDSVYDFPRQIHDSDMLESSPPPPQPCSMVKHRYVNAPPGYMVDDAEAMYMPMDVQDKDDDLYLAMDSSRLDSSRLDSSSRLPSRPMRGDDDMLYSYPSSNQPVRQGAGGAPPVRGLPPLMLPKQPGRHVKISVSVPASSSLAEMNEDNIISHTRRTKSFKRNIECPYKNDVILPTKRFGHDSQSSSDDETDSVSSHDRSLDNLDSKATELTVEQQFAQMKSLNSTPPPPTSKRPGEVQYLDLDLNNEPSDVEKSPVFQRSAAVRCVTPTDYKEIDFVKTKALNDLQKDLEKKRKSSEKSLDE